MPTVIELVNIVKTYGSGSAAVRALRGVCLQISAGEFVTIRGSSGSGKSTLMNILGCLDRPSEGDYFLDGDNIQQLSKTALAHLRNRKLGFVFQGFNLLKRMSAVDNVEMPLVYSGASPLKRREKALRMLHLVGLGERVHHMPNQMSGGQQQRVAIARALVNSPSILLGDEPTGNLDSKTNREVIELFRELNEKSGITVLLVTHNLAVARNAKRMIVLRDGLIVCDTTDFRMASHALDVEMEDAEV